MFLLASLSIEIEASTRRMNKSNKNKVSSNKLLLCGILEMRKKTKKTDRLK